MVEMYGFIRSLYTIMMEVEDWEDRRRRQARDIENSWLTAQEVDEK